MIDTHTHLYFPEYGDEITDVMRMSLDAGVSHFILPNVDLESVRQIKDLNRRFPDITYKAIGLHPTEVREDWEQVVDYMEKEILNDKYIAVGEIGIDLYWDKTFETQQKDAFARQLEMAQENGLPVIIHCRNAVEETLEVLNKVKPTVPMVFHSFTGNKEDIEKIRESFDPYFGINGVVTYKNAPELREALPVIGLDRIVLETDAPFLTPVPHRGKRNDSSYLGHIRDKIAETLQVSPQEVDQITDRNARNLFNI